MRFRSILFLSTFALTGCGGGVGSERFDNLGLTLADDNMVRDCQFLGDVSGMSSFYGMFAAAAMSSARQSAAEEAQKMGATHLVFTRGDSNDAGTFAYGRTYKCQAPSKVVF